LYKTRPDKIFIEMIIRTPYVTKLELIVLKVTKITTIKTTTTITKTTTYYTCKKRQFLLHHCM
jgi:hypothetical protein